MSRNMTIRVGLFLAAALLLTAHPAFAQTPYVYQTTGQGKAMSASVELETAVGTREARPFGNNGYETGVKLRFSPVDIFSMEAHGGVLFDNEGYESFGAAFDAYVAALVQEKHYITMTLGAGYFYDYQHVHVPRVHLVLSRSFGKFNLSLPATMEIPIDAPGRDEVDLIFGLAAAYEVVQWFTVGAEFMLEDVEGFWEGSEAEGGAKLIVGPTVAFNFLEHWSIKANAAAVIPATTNAPTRVQPGVTYSNDPGFLGRLALGYSF